MRTLKKLMFLAIVSLMANSVFAQGSVKGTVIDSNTNEPLPGANIMVVGTDKGTTTDFDGNFNLEVPAGNQKIKIVYLGYNSKEIPVTISDGQTKDLGKISLQADQESLSEVVIVGKGVVDLAHDRKTPIAVSTITASEIQTKIGNFDLPELLTETPSVQSVKRGGYGDGQMYLRGFNQSNTAFLLNGQPINGMEDGKMYWSNWSGIMDIANAVQVQRGLGSSKLAISSVGGTVNIVTKTVDSKQGGFVKLMGANNNYYKAMAYYSTGIMSNGLAVGAMFGQWQGDGYRNGTPGKGQTYYLSFGYKPNEKHIFNFLITGAPQWHGDAWTVKLKDYLEKGRTYNKFYGYKEGKLYPGLRNFYHKPILNLSWDWNISDSSKLSTVLYGSLGRGGYQYMEGAAWGLVNGNDGGMDFDALVAANKANGNATGFMKGSFNLHNWYGVVSNFEKQLNDNISFNFGGDVRIYQGQHFRGAVDLMGATGYNTSSTYNGSYTIDNVYGGYSPWKVLTNPNSDHKQRYSYDYSEDISYYGIFGQVEYSNDKFSTFFQGAVSDQTHQATNFFNYPEIKKSDKISNLGYDVKGGFSYKLNDKNKSYFNAGYYSRQPFHDDLFMNLRKSVDLNKLANKNQTIIGFELGHTFKTDKVKLSVDLYHTTWGNRTWTSFDSSDPNNVIDFQFNNVNEIHKGIETQFSYKPMRQIKLFGFISYGDWKYGKEPTVKVFDENTGNEITDTYTDPIPGQYKEGDKIGGAAQFTSMLGLQFKPIKSLRFDLSQKYYDNLYSMGGIKLPAYSLVDTGLSYKLNLSDKYSLDFRLNINNLFDKFYIEYSKDGKEADETTTNWNGINVENNVSIGFGRTWNFGVKFNFK